MTLKNIIPATGGIPTMASAPARTRIAELKAQVLQAKEALASLDDVPQIIALHPATLDRYIETVDRRRCSPC